MSWLTRLFGGTATHEYTNSTLFEENCPRINPANGLPMVNCAIDIEGNPYGTDSSSDDTFINDSMSTSIDSNDDNWSSNSWDD
ncbi:MAG: hypothetical protein IE928_02100 [Gammaproteobacteria bacterium]|nr:hypothetical protein [Gammaproteobacteria bacterium]